MKWGTCSFCKKHKPVSNHHKLSQNKIYRKAYPEFIDHPDNLVKDVCNDCHACLAHWTEMKFCKHFNIKPRTQTGKVFYERLKNKWI